MHSASGAVCEATPRYTVAMPETGLEFAVVAMASGDWPGVCAVYREGIATGDATFEKAAPEWEKWDRDHLRACRFVAKSVAGVIGWAALSPVSGRCVYAGVAEVSVYIAVRARGRGVGTALLAALVAASEREGIWTLQAGVFPENRAGG